MNKIDSIIRKFITFILLISGSIAYAQAPKNKLTGRYSDGITELKLNADSTFELKAPDYIFPYTATTFQNSGVWACSGNDIILNPGKEKRQPIVLLSEKVIEGSDSIFIKISYATEVYENEVLVGKEPVVFDALTIYLNNRKNYLNLVHAAIRTVCAFAPRVKKQVVVDSLKQVRLPRQKVERLGVYTYGFDKPVELNPVNPNANYFELVITQPIDKERTPRSKKVIVKNKYAYYYEWAGKIPTSGLWLNGLRRVE